MLLMVACVASLGGYWAGKHRAGAGKSNTPAKSSSTAPKLAKLPPIKSRPTLEEPNASPPTLEELKTKIQELRGRDFRRGRDMMRLIESVSPADIPEVLAAAEQA